MKRKARRMWKKTKLRSRSRGRWHRKMAKRRFKTKTKRLRIFSRTAMKTVARRKMRTRTATTMMKMMC